MSEIKRWFELILSFIFTALGELMRHLNLETLQKIYYLLAATLMIIAIWKLLTNKKLDIEKISQPASIVDQAHNPKRKGELILKVLSKTKKIVKIGGLKMKEFLKGRGWLQWASLIATVLLLVLGILSAFVPEFAVVGSNFEAYLIALGLVVTPGILSKGKEIGETAKNLLPTKERKKIEKNIKALLNKKDELYKLYEDVILIAQDVAELGGTLTQEQQTRYNTYTTQKNALEAKIQTEKGKLEVHKNV